MRNVTVLLLLHYAFYCTAVQVFVQPPAVAGGYLWSVTSMVPSK
jgi:hypothetical protein